MSRPWCPDGDDVTRTEECVGGGLTEDERKDLEINEDVRESDKEVSKALLKEKELKGVIFEEIGMIQVIWASC